MVRFCFAATAFGSQTLCWAGLRNLHHIINLIGQYTNADITEITCTMNDEVSLPSKGLGF